jgi:hypothetical protein
MLNSKIYGLVGFGFLLIVAMGIPETIRASVQVGCEIRATRDNATTRLDAIISASGAISGTFMFTVKKQGGDEVKSETGEFTTKSSQPSEVKKASITLPKGEGYEASLMVEWPNGSSSCSAAAF